MEGEEDPRSFLAFSGYSYVEAPTSDRTKLRPSSAVTTTAKPEVNKFTPTIRPKIQEALTGQL